jgi:transposase-like protein
LGKEARDFTRWLAENIEFLNEKLGFTLSVQETERQIGNFNVDIFCNGVSTRKIQRITEELCGTSFSKSTVSDLCKALDPVVTAWNERDLSQKAYPFVIVDALYLKIRKDGRVVSQGALSE